MDAHRETLRTEHKLSRLNTRGDGCLVEQGPAVLPLNGKGGSPLKLANRHPSAKEVNMNLFNYRQNLHKETLKLEHKAE